MEAHDQDEAPKALGHRYDEIVFCQRLLFWSHVVFALAIAFIYLSTRDYSHFGWWRRGAGSVQIVRVLIPMSPYALSGLRVSTSDKLSLTRVCAFCVGLALGTVVFAWSYLSHWVEAFSSWLDAPFYFVLLMFCVAQTMVFSLLAMIFLDTESLIY
jgi:hypothetical protein